MKNLLLLLAVTGMVHFSCTKPDSGGPAPTSLAGAWRMVLVKDNATGSISTKPGSISGEVDILFDAASSTNGNISGKTPTNDIWPSDYQTDPSQSLTIPALGITKVMETTWGDAFVSNICTSQSYKLESGGRLTIKTTDKTLTFQKR